MSSQPELAYTFGGRAVLLNADNHSYESSVRAIPAPTMAAMPLHPQPFPPVIVNVSTGAVDANRTIRGSGSNGILNELVMGLRGNQMGGGLLAKLEYMHRPSACRTLSEWRRAHEDIGLNAVLSQTAVHPRAAVRLQGRKKEALKADPECSSPSHRGKRVRCDISLEEPEGGKALRDYKVCQHLYGESTKFCGPCRSLAAARQHVVHRIKRKNPNYRTANGKRRRGQQRHVTSEQAVTIPGVYHVQTIRHRLTGCNKSPTLAAAVDGFARLTPSVWAGILLTEPVPQTDEAAPAQMAEMNLVGGACRLGAFPAMWRAIRDQKGRGGKGHRFLSPWITAMYPDDGVIAAGWCWAMITAPFAATSSLPDVLRSDATACAALATLGETPLFRAMPKATDHTFFMSLSEAVQMYASKKALPSTVRFVFYERPGTGSTRSAVCFREKLDVLHAIKNGWRIELVPCAPLPVSVIRPKLPDNRVHALHCVRPGDLLNPVRGSVSVTTLTEPTFLSPPDIYAGEFITWNSMWWHMKMRQQTAGHTGAPPAVIPPLKIFFSWGAARGGATKTFRLAHGCHVSLTYGGVMDELVSFALDPAIKNVTMAHGPHADYMQYRKGSQHAAAAEAACLKEMVWIEKARAGGAANRAPSHNLFDLL